MKSKAPDLTASMARSMVDDEGQKSIFFIPRNASLNSGEVKADESTNKTGGIFTMKNDQIKFSDLTADILRAENPDLVKAIETAARADAEAKIREMASEATETLQDQGCRIIGLVKLHFGAEAGQKFEKVVESGVTVEQYQAISALNPPSEKKSDEAGKRDELLTAIEKAGDLNVGTGGDVKTSKDFQTMIAEYRAQFNCSYKDALLAVRKAHPKAHEDWIKSVN